MYKAIDQRRSVRKLFVESLVKRGAITLDEAEAALSDFQSRLQAALDETRSQAPAATVLAARPPAPLGVLPHADTAVPRGMLDTVFDHLTAYPEGFAVHPKLGRQFGSRAKLYHEQGEVDWATAELLAFGTLVLEGNDVRLAGEDSRRGTFSQRHAALIDFENGATWIPINTLPQVHGRFWVYDSLLSEYAAVGFEYGYSVANKDALTLWEAQFGDFVNGAQIIIDQYIVAAEDKWGQTSGLVMLLPHGYEGQGPEHSSARVERFLQQAAEDNIQIVIPTTAAQYFHLLRRQMHRDIRKPLVVFTPKSPLRMKESHSSIETLTNGTFEEVLDDPFVTDRESIRRLVFCTGKVAWDAFRARADRTADAAVIRVEQLFPFPQQQLLDVLERYPNAKDLVWLQEEPANMGAWHFVFHRTHPVEQRGYHVRCVSRVESGSPATGSHKIHEQELDELMEETFSGV
jgi:2-oxoglutarate dehydrogenase E1 component